MIDRSLLASAIDVILVLVVLEGCGLVLLRRATRRGPAPRAVLAMLAAGFFLMLATRLALGGAGAEPIAACLLGALVAHVGDLAARWPRSSSCRDDDTRSFSRLRKKVARRSRVG